MSVKLTNRFSLLLDFLFFFFPFPLSIHVLFSLQDVRQHEAMRPLPRSDPRLGVGDAGQRPGVPRALLLVRRLRGPTDQGRSLRDEGRRGAVPVALRDGRRAPPLPEPSGPGLSPRPPLPRPAVPLARIPPPSPPPPTAPAPLDAPATSPQPREPGTAPAVHAVRPGRGLTTQGTLLQWRRRRPAA